MLLSADWATGLVDPFRGVVEDASITVSRVLTTVHGFTVGRVDLLRLLNMTTRSFVDRWHDSVQVVNLEQKVDGKW